MKRLKNNKKLSIQLLAILIFLIGAGFYLFRQYQTKVWRTYVNDRYHFKIRYPPTLYIHGENAFSIALRLKSLRNKTPLRRQPLFSVGQLQGVSNFAQLYDPLIETAKKYNIESIELTPTIIRGAKKRSNTNRQQMLF